jgi:hypothetical protein
LYIPLARPQPVPLLSFDSSDKGAPRDGRSGLSTFRFQEDFFVPAKFTGRAVLALSWALHPQFNFSSGLRLTWNTTVIKSGQP